jgi:hypothetical protein
MLFRSQLQENMPAPNREKFLCRIQREPSQEQIQALVNSESRGNFAEKTIALQKCPGFNIEELIRAGITVFRFEPEPQLGGTGTGHEAPTSRFESR